MGWAVQSIGGNVVNAEQLTNVQSTQVKLDCTHWHFDAALVQALCENWTPQLTVVVKVVVVVGIVVGVVHGGVHE